MPQYVQQCPSLVHGMKVSLMHCKKANEIAVRRLEVIHQPASQRRNASRHGECTKWCLISLIQRSCHCQSTFKICNPLSCSYIYWMERQKKHSHIVNIQKSFSIITVLIKNIQYMPTFASKCWRWLVHVQSITWQLSYYDWKPMFGCWGVGVLKEERKKETPAKLKAQCWALAWCIMVSQRLFTAWRQ